MLCAVINNEKLFQNTSLFTNNFSGGLSKREKTAFSLVLEAALVAGSADFTVGMAGSADAAGTAQSSDSGVVIAFKDSVVTISGLDGVQANELIYFESGASGIALNLEYNLVKALVFGGANSVRTLETVKRSKVVMRVCVGYNILGRVVNPLGVAIDGLGDVKFEKFLPIERKAPGVITRKKN